MDLSIRQKLQRALQDAIRTNGDVVIEKKDGSLVTIKIDFVCYETLVEATSKDGSWLEIPYDQIIDAYS